MFLTQIKLRLMLVLAADQGKRLGFELLATDHLVVCATPTSSGRPTRFVKNNAATAFFAVHLGKLPAALSLS